MATPAPDSNEAQQALHAVRQQQADLVRRNLAPLPAWYWLAGAPVLVLVGLAWDLRGSGRWAVVAVTVAAVIAMMRWQRRWVGAKVRYVWWYQQFDNRTFWIYFLTIAAVVVIQQIMTDVFTRLGLPWPNTLAMCAAAAVFLVTGPLSRVVLRRRLIARIESGSDDGLHGLAYLQSLLPVAEAFERLTGRSSARRPADGTESGKP